LSALEKRKFPGPRDTLERGTTPWVHQTLVHLQVLFKTEKASIDGVLRTLEELIESRAWEVYPEGAPFGSCDAMLKSALGCTLSEFFEEIDRRRNPLKAKAVEPSALPGGQPENRNAAEFEYDAPQENEGYHDNDSRGTSTDYLLARLARDFPEALERVQRGEVTPNRAAVEVGIRKPPLQQRDPVAFIMGAVSRLDATQLYDFEERFNEHLQSRRAGQ
jgi:hypothetical protein